MTNSDKWTPDEFFVAVEQLDELLDCTEVTIHRNEAYNSAIIDLVCQRNSLRDALESALHEIMSHSIDYHYQTPSPILETIKASMDKCK